MEYMLVFTEREGGARAEGLAAEMKAHADELARQGKLRRAATLVDSTGARVRVRHGNALVTDGPVVQNEQVVSGFWIVEADGRDEAIAIARRCPHSRHGVVEAHPVHLRESGTGSAPGKLFAYIFRMEPGLTGDESKLREMLEFQEPMKREGKLLDTAPLASQPPAARIETRGGKLLVTDGPFAETKEGVGGYSLVRLASFAEALALAKRYPHATWGPLELREVAG